MNISPDQTVPLVPADSQSVILHQPNRKRPRDPAVVTRLELNEDLWDRVLEYLDVAKQAFCSQINRSFYWRVGNAPLYARVLSLSGLGTLFPYVTCKARVHAEIAQGDRICMSFMAQELCQARLTDVAAQYMGFLLNPSSGPLSCFSLYEGQRDLVALDQPVTTDQNLVSKDLHLRQTAMLVNLHLMGCNPEILDEFDANFYEFYDESAQMPNLSHQEWIRRNIRFVINAVWGFCPNKSLREANEIADTIQTNGCLPEDQPIFAALEHLCGYLRLSCTWKQFQTHLTSPEITEQLKALGLDGFIRLLDLQERLKDGLPHSDVDQGLLQMIDDTNNTPHLRALATITLASQRLYRHTNAITDDMARAMLHGLHQNYLRYGVRAKAKLLLASFELIQSDCTQEKKLEILALCRFLLSELQPRSVSGLGLRNHGLGRGIRVSVLETMVRLKIEDGLEAISTAEALEYAHQLSIHPEVRPCDRHRYIVFKAFLRSRCNEPLVVSISGRGRKTSVPFTKAQAITSLNKLLTEEIDPNIRGEIQLLLMPGAGLVEK